MEWKLMFCQLIFLLSPYLFSMVNAQDDCTPIPEGVVNSYDLSSTSIPIVANCPGSYIYISVPSVTINAMSDFTINIIETVDDISNYLASINFVANTVAHLEETGLASKSSGVIFSCETVVSGEPFDISYKEVNQTNTINEYRYDDSQIIMDPLKPNEQTKNSFWNKLDIQKFEIGYNFSSSTSTNPVTSLSSSFGFIAIRNSNGKINLIAGSSGTSMKFVVGMPQRNISEGSNHALRSFIDVVTQNDPEAEVYAESRRRIIINYDLGENFTITTPSPETTTPIVPNEDEGTKLFILPVNEISFCENTFDILIDDLTKIAEAERCKLINTNAMSCRNECHMSDDPDRGCVSVIVGLINDPLICNMTQEEFKQKIDEQISSSWLVDFGVDRIELDDCLASQEVAWIITGVSIMAFALLVLIISFVVFKLFQRRKTNDVPYGRISSPNLDTQNASSNAPRTNPYQQPSPFEEVQF